MSAVAAAALSLRLRLRVAVTAGDPATARRLAHLVAQSGHQPVDPTEPADAILTDFDRRRGRGGLGPADRRARGRGGRLRRAAPR